MSKDGTENQPQKPYDAEFDELLDRPTAAILTKDQHEQLIKNGCNGNAWIDHQPVVKLFLPGTPCTWLITEFDPPYTMNAFGLCDLGLGIPELGYVDLDELSKLKGPSGQSVERAINWKPKYLLSVYEEAAKLCERITEDDRILSRFAKPNPPA